jgi:hypothetical protein
MALRTAVWDQMLDARMRQRYFSALFDRFHFQTRAFEIVGALAAATAAASWVATHSSEVAAVLSGLAAAATTIQSVLKLSDQRAGARVAARHWERRARAWEAYWLEVESGAEPALERFALEQSRDVDWVDPEIRQDDPLLRESEHQVHRALSPAA